MFSKGMKKGRRLLAGVLALLLVVTAVPLYGMEAAAEVSGDFEYEIYDDDSTTVTITGYTGSGGDVVIPSEIDGKNVTSIGNGAFWECSDLTSVTIADSVTSIEDSAFVGCESLTSVTIPNSVTSIGWQAFSFCSSLTSVTIPASVSSIGSCAFSSCSSLTEIEVDQNNANYSSEDGVLFDKDRHDLLCCPGGKNGSYVIPETVTRIGSSAFEGCSSLTSVTIPNSVTRIGSRAFYFCTSLTSVTIPNSVISIGEKAFLACASLTSVTIPNSVTSIGEYAFYGCSRLTSVEIPSSVTKIEEYAFGYLTDEVKIPNFTIYGAKGSEAETYAKDNGFIFLTEKPSTEDTTKPKADLSKAAVILKQTSYVYDGKAKTPAVTVKLDGKTLKKDTDYTVSYKDNKKVGTAKVTMKGKGDYTGSKTVNFKIKSSITCKKTTYQVAYGAKPFKINATSKDKLTFTSSNAKVAAVDKNSGKVTIKNTGTATITVKTAKESVKVTVKVSPKKAAVTSAKPVKGKKLTVKWKKDTRATGYQVQICTSKNFKNGVISKKVTKNSKTSYTFTKLKKGKKYYVRVRSYKKSGKETLYGAWSKVKQSGKIK